MKNQFQIIYIDPPWKETGGGKIKRGADRHYPLMSIKEIKDIQVPLLADENCHLYLWTTNNFLEKSFEIIKSWGFSYVTTITWVKHRIGLGQYFRGQTEHCLFCKKGQIPYKIINGKRQQAKTCFFAKRKEHSQKPKKMREFIEKVSDREGFNKIELFAREEIENWTCIGNEIDGKDINQRILEIVKG